MDAAADVAATATEQVAGKPGACVECSERCQRDHRPQGAAAGSSHFSSAQPLHPCFMRTVADHNLGSNMAIPKAFVQMHARDLPGSTVDLEGVNGKVWLVTVIMTSIGTATFRFGWHVFSADNNLKAGDSLLFTMVAKNRFTVRVFGKNGMESVPGNPTNATFSHNFSRSQPPMVGMRFNLDEEGDEFVGTGSGNSGRSDDNRENGWRASAAATYSACEGIPGASGPTIREIIQDAHAEQTAGEPIRRRNRSRNQPWRPQRHSSTTAHRNRQGEVPLNPGSQGGWDGVTYNTARPPLEDPRGSESASLPDLNIAVKPEPTADANPRKRTGLAVLLQKMVRSGQFSKRQREDYPSSSRIRVLAEGMYDEDEKPFITPISRQFDRPRPHHSPINSSRNSVKAEPVDSIFASVKVKTEPMYVLKTEDMSLEDMSTPGGAVDTQRRGEEGSTSLASRSTALEKEADERIWYAVLGVFDKRLRGSVKELLVQIVGTVAEKERSKYKVVEQERDGSWWVPCSHFDRDYSGCYLS